MAREGHCLAVSFVVLTANELSEKMGVDGWGCYISINVVHIDTAFWLLVKIAPSLASMSDANMLHMMDNST